MSVLRNLNLQRIYSVAVGATCDSLKRLHVPKYSHHRDLILYNYSFTNYHDDHSVFDMLSYHQTYVFVVPKQDSNVPLDAKTMAICGTPSNVIVVDSNDDQFDHPDGDDTLVMPQEYNDSQLNNLHENILQSCGRQGILLISGNQLNKIHSNKIWYELNHISGTQRGVIFSQAKFPQLCQNWYHNNVQYLSWNPTWFLSNAIRNELK